MLRKLATVLPLLLFEAHAVGALIHGGICLMGADVDLAQRTVVLSVTVMGTLVDRTCDCLVGVTATAHLKTPPSSVVEVV